MLDDENAADIEDGDRVDEEDEGDEDDEDDHTTQPYHKRAGGHITTEEHN
jgi:hypothetical protein